MTLFVTLNLLRLFTLEPMDATKAGALAAGAPELVGELIRVCRREGPGHGCDRRVGVHSNNTPRAIHLFHSKALARGWIDPVTCPEHRVPRREFSVRGMHGQAAAYSLRFLGPCTPPGILDIPFFSALAAARRAVAMCSRWKACDEESRHALWYGKKNYRPRPHV